MTPSPPTEHGPPSRVRDRLSSAEACPEGLPGPAHTAVSPCEGSKDRRCRGCFWWLDLGSLVAAVKKKRQTCCVGDGAVASLTSGTPVLDARMESLFSFLRSRSTCRDAGEKSGLGSALGLEQNCLSREEAGVGAAAGVGVSRGQQPREAKLRG